MSQGRLFEFRMGDRAPEALAVTSANADAAMLLRDSNNWPGSALALVGPPGSGKTHLALAWALETGARTISASAEPDEAAAAFEAANGRAWIDNADHARNDPMLWRLLDLARVKRGALLLIGVRDPVEWPTEIKDLRSRLDAMPIARLGEPDHALLDLVLRRHCRERFIELSDDAAQYLSAHMPPTFSAVGAVADALDEMVVRGAKPVSMTRARQALARIRRTAR